MADRHFAARIRRRTDSDSARPSTLRFEVLQHAGATASSLTTRWLDDEERNGMDENDDRCTAHDPRDTTRTEEAIQTSRDEYLFVRKLATWAGRRGNPELAARLYSAAAFLATSFHPGFFVDPVAENELLKIGRSVDEDRYPTEVPLVSPSTLGRSLLHIFSEINTVGGHCRTLIHWIRHDPHTQHTVVVLRQKDPVALSWLDEQLAGSGSRVHALNPDSGMLTRAIQLRKLARRGFSACVNHVGQAESIPTIAFATSDCPPVLLIDHADHSFWLGVGVTDITVHQRPVGNVICDARRGARSCFVLPIPLDFPLTPAASDPSCAVDGQVWRDRARRRLGIEEGQLMAITVGRRDKYRPLNRQNFFRSAALFAKDNPDFVLHVVGVEREQAESWSGMKDVGANLVFHGEVPVASHLRTAADIYLESYPFGSQTALLEAAQAGLAAVRSPVDTALLATSDDAIDGWLPVPDSEEAYWQAVLRLMRDPVERERSGRRLSEQVEKIHTGQSWQLQLAELYRRIEQTHHAPEPLSPGERGAMDHNDIALHRWQRWRGDEWTSDRQLRLHVKSALNDVMARQLLGSDRRLLPSMAARCIVAGRVDRTILEMGLRSMFGADKS